MSGFDDLYSNDAVKVNPTAAYPSVSLRDSSHRGMYEDNLRAEQSRISMSTSCINPNPYIQDSITKSQRHNPIRPVNVETRASHIAHMSPEPGLAAMYGAPYVGTAHNQAILPAPGFISTCQTCARAAGEKTDHVMKVDSTTLLYIFIFIILVYMCMNFWKSANDVRKSLEGGFQSLRDIIVTKTP